MNVGTSPLFDQCYETLTEQGSLKTWSLIVTIFGDLAPDGIAALDSQLLGALCATFSVRPEALRVALHRLRKDGWLDAERSGRRSVYRLSKMGQELTREVYRRIYRSPVTKPCDWHIIISPEDAPEQPDSVPINSSLSVSAVEHAAFGFKSAAADVPVWFKARMKDEEAASDFKRFECSIRDLPKQAEMLSSAQRLCLRLLVLHYWRRLLLRRPDAPERLLGPDWEGFGARVAARRVFDVFDRPDPVELSGSFIEAA
ncbi:hypothetical protein DZK27_15610 [Rhodobacteraceae bacterium 63075]|nr:hypothetical protein DZK27_15610 [Rhodobacteraceae bacterium 63075]